MSKAATVVSLASLGTAALPALPYIAGNTEHESRISLATLEEALALTEWLKHEARRIYAFLVKAFDPIKADRLFNFARSRGGRITASEAARNGAGGRNPADVETLMKAIIALGLARWEPRPPQSTGGRPTRLFTVLDAQP